MTFPKPKKIIIALTLIITFFAVYVLIKLRQPPPTSQSPTPSPAPASRFNVEGNNDRPPGWNKLFNQQLNNYIQNYGPRDKALAKIRKSAPVNKIGFTIDYSYKNNTYTVTLIAPYDQNKTKALDWFSSQGITNFDHLRIEWKQQ